MLIIKNLSKSFYTKTEKKIVFDNFNLEIEFENFISIIGHNGCGKTTLLNMIAGIDRDYEGSILFNGKNIDSIKVGYIFQNYSETLFPWMNIIDNIAFPLKLEGLSRKKRYEVVIRFCQIYDFSIQYDAFPYSLSGGQQQLVVILRALVHNPDIILMDEAFSSLDHFTSLDIQNKILSIKKKINKTIIFISHRVDEALYLSDRIICFNNHPVNVFEDFKVDFPYPRNLSLLSSEEFNNLKKKVLLNLKK